MEQLFVIKIGGNVIDDPSLLHAFLKDFSGIYAKKILVHGGGRIATRIGDQLGIVSNYVNGRRITDEDTIDLVTMVYGGLVNKKIVARLQSYGCNSIGLTGADANVMQAVKRPVKEIDYGFVGDLNSSMLAAGTWELLLEKNLVPVLAPLTHDGQGQMLNTNADTMAAVIASVMSAKYRVRLMFCFEKKGVLERADDDHSVIPSITAQNYPLLQQRNILSGGIIPKIDNAFKAVEAGVQEVLIGDARDLLQNTGAEMQGTLIT